MTSDENTLYICSLLHNWTSVCVTGSILNDMIRPTSGVILVSLESSDITVQLPSKRKRVTVVVPVATSRKFGEKL